MVGQSLLLLVRLALLTLIIVSGAGCAGSVPLWQVADPLVAERTLYLVSHGWHTGLVLRPAEIGDAYLPERQDFPQADYLEIGWGEWDFYQTPDFHLDLAAAALFWPNRSVLHIVAIRQPLTNEFPFSTIVQLPLSAVGLDRLSRYLHDSFARDQSSPRVAPLGPGLYGDSRFYPARGRFHLFNTCNTWTVGALRAAGFPISPFTLTATDVLVQLCPWGRVLQTGPARFQGEEYDNARSP